jgi:hypothetical protein
VGVRVLLESLNIFECTEKGARTEAPFFLCKNGSFRQPVDLLIFPFRPHLIFPYFHYSVIAQYFVTKLWLLNSFLP